MLLSFGFHRRGAEPAEITFFSFAVDPRGIGFAFHRAGTTANENHQPEFSTPAAYNIN